MSGGMQVVSRQQIDGGNQGSTMAPESPLVADSTPQLTPPARVSPEVALMGMAREALQDLNEVVKALAHNGLQAIGNDRPLENLSSEIINAAAQCKVGTDGIDGLVLAGALFEIERVVRKSERIDEAGNVAITTFRKEHRAFIQGLLDARKVGALSEAEAAALGTYEDCRVGDDQGALVVWLGGVRTDDDFLQERTRLALYVRELG